MLLIEFDSSIDDASAVAKDPFRAFATRDSRKRLANYFVECNSSERDVNYPVIQACIRSHADHAVCSHGDHADHWTEQESKIGFGITWVALQGIDTTCVVVRREDLAYLVNKYCPRNDKHAQGRFLQLFWNFITTEVEDLTLPCGEAGKMTSHHIKKPFVAVSVASGDESHLYLDSALEFLKEEMEMDSNATSTLPRSLKTAIFTLCELFKEKFKAKEIEIFTLRSCSLSSPVIEYPIRGRRSIEDYLKNVNKQCSGGSSSSEKRRFGDINKAWKRMRLL